MPAPQQINDAKENEEEQLPVELQPFIPAGYVAYNFIAGDVNGDDLEDYLLRLNLPEDANSEEVTPYRLNIIMRQKNNSLKLAASNDKLTDAMSSLDIIEPDSLGKGFVISNETRGMGATSSYTIMEYNFKYHPSKEQWFLNQMVATTGMNSPAAATGQMIHWALQENPNFTQAQQDSVKKYYDDQLADPKYGEPEIVITTEKDFGKIPFAEFTKD